MPKDTKILSVFKVDPKEGSRFEPPTEQKTHFFTGTAIDFFIKMVRKQTDKKNLSQRKVFFRRF
jgi:hypothetical protein